MSTDATPSWSGYIFQGEVALCKALEEIFELGNNIHNDDCLILEDGEDFSLTINNVKSVYQVKAYLSRGSDKISKYKSVIKELLCKYYFDKRTEIDPEDANKQIHICTEVIKEDPLKCTLITHNNITDYDPSLNDFEDKFKNIKSNYFELIHGQYTLGNIIEKIDKAVSNIFPEFGEADIELKRNHCLVLIHNAIKERHINKEKKSFKLQDIKQWIIDADTAFNEEIGWIEIIKNFFGTINRYVCDLEESDPNKIKLENYLEKINELGPDDTDTLKNIIKDRLYPHIKYDNKLKLKNFSDYDSTDKIKNIIIKSFKSINDEPSFKSLSYSAKGKIYQLSQIDIDLENNPDRAQKRDLQECCENIESKKISEVDTYITRSLNLDRNGIKKIARDVLRPNENEENEENENSKLIIPYENKFEFKSVNNSINEINNGTIN